MYKRKLSPVLQPVKKRPRTDHLEVEKIIQRQEVIFCKIQTLENKLDAIIDLLTPKVQDIPEYYA
jgi:hypothetical protein